MVIGKYLQEIEDKVENMIKRHQKFSETDYLVAFRGENKDYARTKLMPSLFRDDDYIEKEKYLFELLGDYDFLKNGIDRNIEKAIEAQHYIAISRMLDITFSILPAMYFACNSSDKDIDKDDAIIYIFCFPEHYSPHSQYIEQYYTDVLNDKKNITYSGNFKVISHSYSNDRIKAQSGGFIFFPGREYRPIPEIYYEKIKIDKNDKKDICEELKLIFNINEAILFPEKEKLIPVIRQKFIEGTYKKRSNTITSEVESYFDRLDYELQMSKIEDNVKLLRFLRKEKSDLLYYIDNIMDSDNVKNKEKIEQYIKNVFQFLLLKYERR